MRQVSEDRKATRAKGEGRQGAKSDGSWVALVLDHHAGLKRAG